MSSKPISQPDIPQLGLVLFLVLGAIGALTPLAIDMYLPAMPTIAQDFGVTAGAVQTTLTVYTAGSLSANFYMVLLLIVLVVDRS